MPLPDLSNSMYVARLRYIQSIHEPAERRNPDVLVRHFLSTITQLRGALLGQDKLAALRADPFYYFLVARTRYYDQVLNDAIHGGARHVVSIGSGSDTRPHRFAELLSMHDVTVLECDQAEAIRAKLRITKRLKGVERVEYLPVDLNDDNWPDLMGRLRSCRGTKVLVTMEGVSPYINDGDFRRFLKLLATELAPGSQIAYDYKLHGVKEDFGQSARTTVPFRLPSDRDQVAAFHKALRLELTHFELSSELCARLLPNLPGTAPLFTEDALARLQVGSA